MEAPSGRRHLNETGIATRGLLAKLPGPVLPRGYEAPSRRTEIHDVVEKFVSLALPADRRVLDPDTIVIMHDQHMMGVEDLNAVWFVIERHCRTVRVFHRLGLTYLFTLIRQHPQITAKLVTLFKTRHGVEAVLVVAVELNAGETQFRTG